MGFEKFDETGRGRGRPAGADPMISLCKSGSTGIDGAAISAFFEDDDGAVMYYNEADNQFGSSRSQIAMARRRRTRCRRPTRAAPSPLVRSSRRTS